MTKEARITKKLIAEVKQGVNIWAKKRHQSAFSTGEPDVAGVWNGRSFFIEVKRWPDGELTKLQAKTLCDLAEAGAYTALYVWDSFNKIFRVIDAPTKPGQWINLAGKVRNIVDEGFASVSLKGIDIMDRIADYYANKRGNVRYGDLK